MKRIGILFMIIGVICLGVFGYQLIGHEQSQKQSLIQAEEKIEQGATSQAESDQDIEQTIETFETEEDEAFATLEIPKLEKTLPIVEGTDPDSLQKGVGHLSNSVFPGQGEQILLSGHRDTVFRDFGELEIGDTFIVQMPYGEYTYEIKETEIVPEDDTSVIREMGEEVLVVTTCYPFHFVGNAPERFVAYAYPVSE
ncbi:class D sortase [Oceanobacillus jeddahense]|uniref:Class D sortase n=1 Tax=Oceanobacillus jeddahense TaxID=1462527 RepID=A0ABY5JUE1_9BACI|nr:class D sortase [Oceanobacillus jeddahense]UUI03400.1 class D sortase [Oceanobacillus jeddahense]